MYLKDKSYSDAVPGGCFFFFFSKNTLLYENLLKFITKT